jgi:hypothetical protein
MRANRIRQHGVRRRLTITTLIATGLALGASGAMSAPVLARDSNCTRVTLYNSKGHSAYVLSENVGLVAWRTSMSITAYDRCSHGEVRATVGINNANVQAEGGTVVIAKVQYRRTGSTTWYSMYKGACASATSCNWAQLHVDLTRTWRITHVRLYTYLVFNRVPTAGRYHTCNLVTRTCS